MHTLHKGVYILAISLSGLAGCVDAIGFLQLGGYVISFMSGNSTRLAVNLAEGQMGVAVLLGGILLLFVMGSMMGALVRHFSQAGAATVRVLVCVTALLTGAAFSYETGHSLVAIAFMTLAMGAENSVLQRGGDVVGLTYMTGTLVKLGQQLAGALLGGHTWTWVPYLLLWLGLLTGGVIGTLLFHFFGLQSIWFAVLWAGSITVVTASLRHRIGV